jgi:hypothetical protein
MKYLVNLFLIINIAAALSSCNRDTYEDYYGAVPNDIISVLDLRPLYRGEDVILSKETMFGADKLAVVVASDHTEKNMPAGLLVVQDGRRLATLRGISIELGAAAAKYHSGDSLLIDVTGSTLTRKNGILTITGLTEANITNKGKGFLAINVATVAQLKARPDNYESTLTLINKASFNPALQPGGVIGGIKPINDGFGDLMLYTDPATNYANNGPYALAAYVGIPFGTAEGGMEFRTRSVDDIVNMGISSQDLLITGFQSDPKGGDGGYEYVQMLATTDINFTTTPYSIVFSTNSGNSSSATPLDAGWATGGQRTIKWNITSGSVLKGKFFYFGFQGKKINGSAGAYSFPAATNYYQKSYLTTGTHPVTGSALANVGEGGLVHVSEFSTSGPWPNSGNTAGVAIFKGTAITEATTPEDVLFVATGGATTVYDDTKSPILGYRICNNDWYSMYSLTINQATYKPVIVPYLHYRSAVNMTSMAYPTPTDIGYYSMMGGVYNMSLGRWTTARKQTIVELVQTTATIDTLEKHPAVTRLVE